MGEIHRDIARFMGEFRSNAGYDRSRGVMVGSMG
jgi:hypothetical protein